MKKYISLSQYPGKQGQYYYTEFFKLLNIDAVYEPRSTDNLAQSIVHVLEENISGISVSMPFKKEIINYLDSADELVTRYQTCNTVVINQGKLHGYNCDYAGAKYIAGLIRPGEIVSVLGMGSMGSMIADIIPKAKRFSLRLNNWDSRHYESDVIINCTNQGTATNKSPLNYVPLGTRLVIDLTVNPCELEQQSKASDVKYISGQEFYKYQFLDQFCKYFNITVSENDYDTIRNRRV